MNPSTLQTAINEAKRFIEKAEKVPISNTWKDIHGVNHMRNNNIILPGKYPAACKRASLDLSRALADLRAGK